VTRRKPLQWDDIAGRKVPACVECCYVWFSFLFNEAIHSVCIETGDNPATLSRRYIEAYHDRRHPSGWEGD
jgi:hypothetical protein